MNKLIKQNLKNITEQLNALEELLGDTTRDLNRALETQDKLLKEKWSDRKRITTLERINKEYDEIKLENETMQEEQNELRSRLATLLSYSKAIHESVEEAP